MANNQRLELRQSQTLVMTAQMKQSLEMLQMPSIELGQKLAQELEKNPFLSRDEQGQETSLDQEESSQEKYSDSEEIKDIVDAPKTFETEQEVNNNEWETSNSEIYTEEAGFYVPNHHGGSGEEGYSFENIAEKEKSLKEYILAQINTDITEPAQRLIALHLLEQLDDAGYISAEYVTLKDTLGCEISLIDNVLNILQKFDPPGIFARNLKECLSIQLREKNHLDPAMQVLLDNLDLLAKHQNDELLKLCQVSKEDLLEMIQEIKKLDPKPGSNFQNENIIINQPDIFVKRNAKGGWSIELNNEVLPRVLVNKKYYSEVLEKTKDQNEKKFLSEQINQANWWVKTLNQRAETILKVATEIVNKQSDFFNKGILYLRPLILKDIAEELKLHESTISRVVNNKYMTSPRGTFELKYFFTSAIKSSYQEQSFSSESIKHLIKQAIDSEEKSKPYSDDKIVEILKNKGVDIARRTVAKYREELKISSSTERKNKYGI